MIVAKLSMFSSFQKLVKSGSELLDRKQQYSWKKLDAEERKKSATSLIVSLEQMALEVASTMSKEETVSSVEQNLGNRSYGKDMSCVFYKITNFTK